MLQATATPLGVTGQTTEDAQPSLVRYVVYARKSTEQDEKQALSIDSQIKEMLKIAERDRLEVADIFKEAHSAKDSGQRPVFNQMITDLKAGKFNGILAWAPDRLSRNAGDLGALVDLMDQKILTEVRTYGQRFTNSPNEKFLLMILGAQGKLENDQKGLNVKRGQRARCEMGLWPAPAPTGYLNDRNRDKKCHILADPKRAPVVKQMFEKIAYENWSGKKIYRWLKDDIKFTSVNEKPLTLSNVYIILKNTLYYGMFQYPKKSGNWYTGKHEPLITKELYNRVQEQLKRSEIVNPWGSKEFAFTKLIVCGFCGATITADEKFKKLKNGGANRHVYYGCSKRWKDDCKCGFIKEEELIEQLAGILDTVKLDKIGIREKIEKEIGRYRKFQMGVLGINEKENQKAKDIDIRNYAKYILKEGEIFEKRELLSCLRSKLILKNKKIYLEE
jgi:DNA invertase Pin-like site-specific DNA recombinase